MHLEWIARLVNRECVFRFDKRGYLLFFLVLFLGLLIKEKPANIQQSFTLLSAEEEKRLALLKFYMLQYYMPTIQTYY